MSERHVFYLGTHETSWLRRGDIDVPLFVSARRLRRRVNWPKATHRWAMDSGGFSELAMFGGWVTTADEYAEEVQRATEEVGMLDWAAPQDWMCEPSMLAQTGLSVAEHQHRTIANYLDLTGRGLTQVIPVLQGWTLDEYLSHFAQYADAGVDLTQCQTVGIGSICRRGQDAEIIRIMKEISALNVPVHAFGVRGNAYRQTKHVIQSADSLAWSFNARRNPPLPECSHGSCSSCHHWALRWRERLLASQARGTQLDLSESSET